MSNLKGHNCPCSSYKHWLISLSDYSSVWILKTLTLKFMTSDYTITSPCCYSPSWIPPLISYSWLTVLSDTTSVIILDDCKVYGKF